MKYAKKHLQMTPSYRKTSNRRSQGSVIVLVVTGLVLMVILAATYLQVVKSQRVLAVKPVDNVDLVMESVVTLIQNEMTNDIFGPDGELFEADGLGGPTDYIVEPYDYPWTNIDSVARDVEGVEGIVGTANFGDGDDAWLASTAPILDASGDLIWEQITTLTGAFYPAENVTPASFNVPRLRNIWPTAEDADAVLLNPTTVRPTTLEPWNNSVPVDHNETTFWSGLLPTGAGNPLVDTDGDGIGDSLWERAPIKVQDGVEYFMAVRIVDLSSMVNLNVATAITADDGGGGSDYPVNADHPKGVNPTEIDLARIMRNYDASSTATTLDNFLLSRLQNATLPTPESVRSDFWTDAASQWNNENQWLGALGSPAVAVDYNKADPVEELHLRYRNGLVPAQDRRRVGNFGLLTALPPSPADPTTTQGPGLADFLYASRWLAAKERFGETDILDPLYPNTDPFYQHYDDTTDAAWWYFGVPPIAPVANQAANSILESSTDNTNNPRLYFTTASGAAEFIPPATTSGAGLTGSELGLGQVRFPLNSPSFTAVGANRQTAVENLATAIGATYVFPPANLPGGFGSRVDFADQFAVNIQDYRDLDNKVTELNGKLGFEGLPVISEVYVQREYEATSSPNGGSFDTSWDATQAGSSAGFAVEIFNPYQSRILLTDLFLELISSLYDPAGTVTLEITAIPGVEAALQTRNVAARPSASYTAPYTNEHYLYPGERLVLYNDGGDTQTVLSQIDTSDPGTIVVPITDPWPGFGATEGLTVPGSGPTAVNVRLFATDQQTDTQMTTPYFMAFSRSMPDSYVEDTPLDITGTTGYRQRFTLGFGDRLDAITVEPQNFEIIETVNPDSSVTPDNARIRLGIDDKNSSAVGVGIPLTEQIYFSDSDRVDYPGELAMIPVFEWTETISTGSSTGMLSSAWNAIDPAVITTFTTDNNINRLRINLNPDNATIIPTTSNLNIAHGALLLERISTLSPASDGLDNDGFGGPTPGHVSGIDNTDPIEAFIPGKINLNTAPIPVLANALPYPADYDAAGNLMHAIAQQIAYERRAPYRARVRLDTGTKGLVTLNELWGRFNPSQMPSLGATTTPLEPIDPVMDLADDGADNYQLTDGSSNNVSIDFLGNDEQTAAPFFDGIIDDREEEMLLLNWLQNLTTTRSDLFVAYILVKGYESGNLKNVAESGRMIVVLDRSGLRTPDQSSGYPNDKVKVIAKFKY